MKRLNQRGFGMVTMIIFICLLLAVLVFAMIISNQVERDNNPLNQGDREEETHLITPDER